MLHRHTFIYTLILFFTFPVWPGNVQWEIQALQKRRMPILCLWKWFALREPIQTTRRSTFSAAMTPAVSLGPELSTLTRSAALEKEIVWKLSESKEKSLETTLLRDSSQTAVADYERWKRLFILKVRYVRFSINGLPKRFFFTHYIIYFGGDIYCAIRIWKFMLKENFSCSSRACSHQTPVRRTNKSDHVEVACVPDKPLLANVAFVWFFFACLEKTS